MSSTTTEQKDLNQKIEGGEQLEIENMEEVSTKQKFTIFCGTYEGAILGMSGDLSKLDLKYAFKPSTNSLKCMDITGKYLVVGGFDEYLRIYDLKRQRECGILEGHLGTITNIKGHQSIVLSCSEDGNIMAWKMKEFGLLHTLKEHKSPVNDIAVHSSGKIMVSIAKDKRLIIWNLINAKKVFSMNLKYNAYKLELTEKHIITMSDFAIHVIDQETNQEVRVLTQEKEVTLNDFQVYYERLVITGDNNGYIYVHDIETKNYISFRAHESRVKKLKVVKIDGLDIIISISTNGEIHLFDCLVIFNDVYEINESQELKDLKPIYKINTLNRLTTLCVYMDAAKDKINQVQLKAEESEKQKQLDLLNKKKIEDQKKKQNEKKKNQKKIKVTIENENQNAKTYVIDSTKIAKKIKKDKKKLLKQQQKANFIKDAKPNNQQQQQQKQQNQKGNNKKGQQQQQQQQKKGGQDNQKQQQQQENKQQPQQQNQQKKQKKSVSFK